MSGVTRTPQSGIFALGTRSHLHLEFDLEESATTSQILESLEALGEPNVTAGATNMVLGFGPALWRRLNDSPPVDLADFAEVVGLDRRAPATQHDLWIWFHGTGRDALYDCGSAASAALEGVARLASDAPSWVYHDSRDLTGFIDGTANPTPAEAPAVACIPEGRPGAGGAHVIVQRWVHDLASFNQLSVPEQENVFGRRKADSEAIPREQRPEDSHIVLAEIHDEHGDEREIYRRSVPWGTVSEKGLVFIGFSPERDRFDEMLARMFGADGRTIRDRLLDFTEAVSGSYYFAPSLEELRAVGFGGDDHH